MKKLLFIIVLFLAGNIAAQEEFSFQLFFEDALGNKDTLTLGYDPLATDTIDTTFGEVNLLNQPWGNGLDVRIGDKMYTGYPDPLVWINENTYQTKKQVLTSYCNELNKQSKIISIQFKMKDLPIKVQWKDDLVSDTCRNYSCFFGTSPDALSPPDAFWGVPLFFTSDGFSIDKYKEYENIPAKLYIYTYGNPDHSIQYYIDNSDTIGIFKFMFWGNKESLHTNNENVLQNLQLYPNPTSDIVTIDLSNNFNSDNYVLNILQLDGTFIKKQILQSTINSISLSDLKTGVYFFRISCENGLVITKKIIKN